MGQLNICTKGRSLLDPGPVCESIARSKFLLAINNSILITAL